MVVEPVYPVNNLERSDKLLTSAQVINIKGWVTLEINPEITHRVILDLF